MLLKIRATSGFLKRDPFEEFSSAQDKEESEFSPSRPNRVDIHSLSNVDDQLYVCVVVVVRAAGNLCARDQGLLLPSETFWCQNAGSLADESYPPQRIDPPFLCSPRLLPDLLAWPSP